MPPASLPLPHLCSAVPLPVATREAEGMATQTANSSFERKLNTGKKEHAKTVTLHAVGPLMAMEVEMSLTMYMCAHRVPAVRGLLVMRPESHSYLVSKSTTCLLR